MAGLEKKILWPKVEKRGALKGDLGTTVNHLVNAFFFCSTCHLVILNLKGKKDKMQNMDRYGWYSNGKYERCLGKKVEYVDD